MKNVVLLSLLLGFAFIISSCKKGWDCQCVTSQNSVVFDVKNYHIWAASEKKANTECSTHEVNFSGKTTKCTLK